MCSVQTRALNEIQVCIASGGRMRQGTSANPQNGKYWPTSITKTDDNNTNEDHPRTDTSSTVKQLISSSSCASVPPLPPPPIRTLPLDYVPQCSSVSDSASWLSTAWLTREVNSNY